MTPIATTPAEVAATRLAPVVAGVVDIRRQIAALQAREAHALALANQIAQDWADAGATASDAEVAHRAVAAELGAALRVSDRTVQRQMGDAERLVLRFAATTAALEAGHISLAHARVIAEAGDRIIEPELVAEYEASVLDYAQAESASRLRPVAQRRAQWFMNETIRERHAAAAVTRRVTVVDLDDDMAELRVTGPAVIVHGIYDRMTRMAREVPAEHDQSVRHSRAAVQGVARRSLDAIRADLVADLLLTADPTAHIGTTETGLGAILATVQITVPVLSLIDSPADDPFDAVTLAGYGPVDPDTARELTRTAAGWDRILTHPISGAVLAVDRYRPTKKMRRALAVRDQHCRFPGCRQSTSRSDLDHSIDWQLGGKTEVANLGHLCRRHHTLKHHTPWRVVHKPGGVLEWTSPTGRIYPDRPAGAVHFATDGEFDAAPF
jgi:hypothetical protein